MSRNKRFGPFVFLFDDIGDDSDTGGSSGQAGVRPRPCTFDIWLGSYAVDLVAPEGYDAEDFKQWWINNGFSEEAWNELNSALGPLYGNGNDAAPIPGVDDGGEGGEAGGDAVSEAISEMMGDIPG